MITKASDIELGKVYYFLDQNGGYKTVYELQAIKVTQTRRVGWVDGEKEEDTKEKKYIKVEGRTARYPDRELFWYEEGTDYHIHLIKNVFETYEEARQASFLATDEYFANTIEPRFEQYNRPQYRRK